MILLAAEAFGYGPASKAAAIGHRIGAARCLAIADGVAADFLAQAGFAVVAGDPRDPAHVRSVVERHDIEAAVVCLDFVVARTLAPLVPTVFVDSLAFMWPDGFLADTADPIHQCRYVVQDALGASTEATRIGVTAPHCVGAIVDLTSAELGHRAGEVVGNLGGLIAHDDEAFAEQYFALAANLLATLAPRDAPPVLLSASAAALPAVRSASAVRAVAARHPQVISWFRQAGVVYSSPGLTALLELAALDRPALPLPPQNYSQALILGRITRRDQAVHPAWRLLADYFAPPSGLPEADGIRWTRQRLRSFAADREATAAYLDAAGRRATAHPPRMGASSYDGASEVAALVLAA